ncbi:alpha/beta hydrolase [Ilyomonas limi]|uniref:Alpha/beta hydrolase n=1 Tax=Ilyomonas limi TaxID=2575867 RepID=A0A4U3KTY9_9BACT|nr:alpha/beta hydrolase [Ilyomonas limi]
MYRIGALCSCVLLHSFSFSQDTVSLTKALALRDAYHYGREAVYTDALAYQLFSNTLQQPLAGQALDINAKADSLKWEAATADSNNIFSSRGRYFNNRYLYFTYRADKEGAAILNTTGSSSVFVNGVLHAGDPYGAGWLNIPVWLKKGENQIIIRAYGRTKVNIIKPKKLISLQVSDATLPGIVLKQQDSLLKGAIVVLNATKQPLINYTITSTIAGKQSVTSLPVVPAISSRKVIFTIDPSAVDATGKYDCVLKLTGANAADQQTITIEAVNATDRYNNTFISNIDGSLQYFAVTPQRSRNTANSALFLSVHGAGVEATGQAAAYDYKDWGTLVAATNRRPRGFNWEDWGRIDALEVLDIATQKFNPDPEHIFLTGHSMGGHGTWFLGATYPDKWASIGPCSGYPSLKDYGSADGKIPDSSRLPAEKMVLRAGNQSDVLKLIHNYKPFGVYVLHGDSDHVVPVQFARQMRDSLGTFHTDFAYHEVPGAEHWYGNQSVDWPALFQFFKDRQRLPDSAVNEIDFITSSPGISAAYRWASVLQQIHPLQYSHIVLRRYLDKDSIAGTTENVQVLQLNLKDFERNKPVKIQLDSLNTLTITAAGNTNIIYLKRNNDTWIIASRPDETEKNPLRYGTFKEAFNNRMVFVYSTGGTKEENENTYHKAIYDAESWYYRGNGAVDIIADKDYTPAKYKGRNIIIYGNANTNSAWKTLLANCPLQVSRGKITAGDKSWAGDDLGAYFVWPQADALTSVGVVAGTGIKGMNAASANQYFAGGSGFPDFMVFRLAMLKDGAKAIQLAGYFDNNWKLSNSEMVATE